MLSLEQEFELEKMRRELLAKGLKPYAVTIIILSRIEKLKQKQ